MSTASKITDAEAEALLRDLVQEFQPIENQQQLLILSDERTGTRFANVMYEEARSFLKVRLTPPSIMKTRPITEQIVT